MDYNRDVWLNYNTKEELTRIVSRKDILIDEYAFRTINNIQPLGAICPVQVMSNLALLSQQGNNFTGNLFKTDGSGTSYYQSKYYKYIDCETLLQQEKYKLSNGMFLYLVLAPEMFINYQNYIVPARTKGKINSNETGTYFAVTNKDNVDN